MGKPKALATRPLFPEARAILDQQFDTEYWTRTERIPRAELLARVADKEALICLLTEKVDEELLSAAPKLRVAATVSVGYDNIDVTACTRHKVVATHTPGVLDETTADFAWTLLMAIGRRLVEGDAWMRSGTWPGWDLDQLLGGDVWGKTLGIIGFGRIGRGVARRARGFQMRILYSDAARVSLDVERELQAEFASLDRLLRESDFVTLHVPLLPDTRRLISREAFGKMKPTAYLINTSRGPVVDEVALVEALELKQIAGAALDVYEQEPKVHPALVSRKDVILAPHIASASVETRTKMAVMAATNAMALFKGERPPNALNAEALDCDVSGDQPMELVTRNHAKLTLAGARAALVAAQRRAEEIRVPMNIAVVDDGAHLLVFERMDGAKPASIAVALVKARAAAMRRAATGPAMAGDQVNVALAVGLGLAAQEHQTPIRGGVPLLVDGEVVGAIGVSAGSEDQDLDVARAGAVAIDKA